MKRKNLFISVTLAFIFLISTGVVLNSTKAYVYEVNDEIPVDPFTEVGISIPSTVYIEQGISHKLVIEAPQKELEKIEVSVKDDKLIIKPENYGDKIAADVRIYITSPEYEVIGIAGSVELFTEGEIKSDELELKISGSGEMNFHELMVEELELKISGSGKALMKGNGEEQEISIAGSGSVDAENFEVEEAEVKISGSGNCTISANGELEVSIAGSGKVLYKGNPEVESRIAGSGSVKEF